METSPPALKFRFRDHGNDMENGDSVVGDTSTELSSFTSDEDSDIYSDELASMTAKGINHLCLELMELKQASEVDFQDNLISNYSSFIRVYRETEGINNEVIQFKYHLMAQKQLVRNLMDNDCLKTVSDDQTAAGVDESTLDDYNPTTLFKACANEVLETLDNLLFEHRLEEALGIFEIEDSDFPTVKFQEDISPDVWMCYKSDMAERRVMLADKLTLMADNTRVSAAELQKSLAGLSRLGFDHLATRLLFKYYHTRIASGVNNLQSSSRSLPGIYVHDLAKYVFSMMSQAAKSFVVLHGETSPYDSELKKWLFEETEAFAGLFIKHVGSISKINSGLSTVVDSVHFAMSYCSLLESQKLELQPCLIEHILPCMESTLKAHFDHFKKVISIVTSSDVWFMERYLVSGMLIDGTSSSVFDQHPEYCLLTNSGRKFVSLLHTVIKDVSSLVSVMGRSILEELMDLFAEYCFILERALTYETDAVVEGASRIKMAESLSQKVSIIANLSTLEYFFPNVIRSLFKDVTQLKNVIDLHVTSVSGICSRLKARLCKQFIHSIMSNEASCIKDYVDFDLLQGSMPSVPYQILFLEVRKVEELAEDNVVEFDWLVSLLTDLIEAAFDWISENDENWVTRHKNDATDQHSDGLTQFALDMQFLVEVARRGGYLTTDMISCSTDLVSRMESAMVSSGFDLNRYVVDYEKVAKSAVEAIKELEAVVEKTQQLSEDFDQLDDEEYQPHSSINSIEGDDSRGSSEVSFETTTDLLIQDFEEDGNEDKVEDENENEDEVEDETETDHGSMENDKKKLYEVPTENGDEEEESGIKDGETRG
ncbi:putative cullin repeat-like-containing domain superfamily, exocyst complex component Exo84 [Helianthus annuus]|nr:putative cullin repeat-like-containing domain superfamily, exocyst complex component Exo84 [Helianthus annuus]